MESPDILIVGGGPAASALALFLARESPELARRTLIVEKRRHPRHKVCAGGLIPHTLDCLRELGVELSVPHCLVQHAAVRVPSREVRYSDRNLCAVVRRDEFDALLADHARRSGVALREDEKVVSIVRENGFRVVTERGELRPRVVVGADGSGSLVRRGLFAGAPEAVGRAVMCDVPAAGAAFDPERYVFDFRTVPRGLKGYLWEFPCWIDGKLHVNVGAYALDRGGTPSLPELVVDRARELGVATPRLEAFPIRWYEPGAAIGASGALLVGDAAGCDPLMGEGISYAFEYARLAARELRRAFDRGDLDLTGYSAAVARSWLGRKLRRLGTATRVFYGRGARLSLALAARSPRLQHVGIRWYNG
ncbi:MAG: FAD-dependent monooxygenase, partial [Candidatus Binatia bacterium]